MSLLRRRMMVASAKEPDVPDTPTEELDYLTIIPLHEEEVVYQIMPYGGVSEWEGPYIQDMPFYYRINNGDWIEVNLPESEDGLVFTIMLNKNTNMQLKCRGCDFSWSYNIDTQFFRIKSTGEHNISGTPMSLMYGDEFKENNVVAGDVLGSLFYNNTGLTRILNPKTFLPYTELELFCYSSMFENCSNLVNAPELPAKTLISGCYSHMFLGCSKISYIKMLGTEAKDYEGNSMSVEYALTDWVDGVSPTGTFVANKDATWDTTPGALGYDGVPAGWTVVNDGEENGGGEVKLISFTIVEIIFKPIEVEYNAIEGMTWVEWVDSEYNTGGYYIYEKHVLTPDHISVAHSDTGIVVLTDEVIISKEYIWN